jgi:hypothetical protein
LIGVLLHYIFSFPNDSRVRVTFYAKQSALEKMVGLVSSDKIVGRITIQEIENNPKLSSDRKRDYRNCFSELRNCRIARWEGGEMLFTLATRGLFLYSVSKGIAFVPNSNRGWFKIVPDSGGNWPNDEGAYIKAIEPSSTAEGKWFVFVYG